MIRTDILTLTAPTPVFNQVIPLPLIHPIRPTRTLPQWCHIERRLEAIPWLSFALRRWHTLRKKHYIRRFERLSRRNPASLYRHEFRRYSQYGEDGVISEIFRRIGVAAGYCVEFGIETGEECNTRLLLTEGGWRGLLLDGSNLFVQQAKSLYSSHPGVRVAQAFVTADNIRHLLRDHDTPRQFDLLSVDIDGNDYWVLASLLTEYHPRVIVVEYNARWVPPMEWVMPYHPAHVWDGSVVFGASLAAFAALLGRRGYTLVHCNFAGNNAFFVADDELHDRFPVTTTDRVRELYAAPLYHSGFGHPVTPPRIASPQPATR